MANVTVPAGKSQAIREIAAFMYKNMLRRHTTIFIGALILLAILFVTVFAPWMGASDPQRIFPMDRLKGPSAAHWFGTDMLGRDIYSRVVYGARISLIVGAAVAVLAISGGLMLGLVAGFHRMSDTIIMRLLDGVMAIPPILLAIALMALTRGSLINVIVALTVAEIPRVARLVRSLVLSLREQLFVEAAITSGSSSWRIMVRHILPNAVAPLLVQGTYICAAAMILESVLSFIGAGTPPDVPSWGNIMAEGRTFFQLAPQIILFPGILLSVTVLAVNLIGDGLRDALDPRLARQL